MSTGTVSDETLERILDAADASPFDGNEHGLWCRHCGWHAAAPWFFEDEDYTPPEYCGDCGFEGEP